MAFGVSPLFGVLIQLAVGRTGRLGAVFDEAEYRPRDWLGSGIQYYPMNLARAVGLQGPMIVLKLLETSEAAGHYGAP